MSYQLALTAAGANVLAFKTFGDYQGTWLAFVEFKGQKGIVLGSFGSCEMCDAFQSEFGWYKPYYKENEKYFIYDKDLDLEECTKEEYEKCEKDYLEKLTIFGISYLITLYDINFFQRILENLNEEDDFDSEKKEYCTWAIEQFKTFI